jgi:esterase/lipase
MMATKTSSTTQDQVKQQTEEAIERVRELNEQILQASRQWGLGFLDAYEQNMRTFADFQDKAAASVSDVEWISQVVKAQADFTREMTNLTTQTARRLLK